MGGKSFTVYGQTEKLAYRASSIYINVPDTAGGLSGVRS